MKTTVISPLRLRHLLDNTYAPSVDACWEWQGHLNSHGYGQVRVEGRKQLVHRLVQAFREGRELESQEHVRHVCDTPSCVNPAHLLLGSHKDNMRDRDERGRTAKGERHGNSKLTRQEVRRIKARIRGGETQAQIARDHGVTKQCVGKIARGEGWTHVE